jgi:hypothetical protein
MSRLEHARIPFGDAFLAMATALGAWACGSSETSASGPALSASAVAFGDVRAGSSASFQVLELRAPAERRLEIESVTLPDPFRHDLSLAPLQPGERRPFRVTLDGGREGVFQTQLTITFAGMGPGLGIPVSGRVVCVPYTDPVFGGSKLAGAAPDNPTSLQFGPDGRLYVAEQYGLIHVYDVQRLGQDDYVVSSAETIDLVQQIPNHDDDGTPNPAVNIRLVTGLVVVGTPLEPVLLVTSSDPRIQTGHSPDSPDTNSGVLSRLRREGGVWVKLDLVRGLPRSKEAHVSNGLQYLPGLSTAYIAQGGHTNKGAPSTTLGKLPEYALSAAILAVDLAAIGETTYDLPTLDDEDRPGAADANDPFGGNQGKNQARLVSGGPVSVHSPGWRNPYDLVLTADNLIYAFDNGPNSGWGAVPASCTNALDDGPSGTRMDQLHYVQGQGYYAGHANPTRANLANTFNPSNPQSPVAVPNPIECQWLDPDLPLGAGGDGNLALVPYSTNGIAEYLASNFLAGMQGQLLVTSLDKKVRRIRLSPDKASVLEMVTLFSNVGVAPLDVTCQADWGPQPGTVWVADFGADEILVYEPIDYSNFCGVPCSGAWSWALDEDGDGYKNADELENGTNPCSPGDVPPDVDLDLLSDMLDPDDDNDTLTDEVDPFAIDPLDGLGTLPPFEYTWFGSDPGHGLLGLGFTGLMCNGVDDYLDLFEPVGMTAGGAAGVLTVEGHKLGSAVGSLDKQRFAFQFGVAVDESTGPYYVQTRVLAPFFGGQARVPDQAHGLFAGTGKQDNFVRLVLASGAPDGALEVGVEIDGTYQGQTYPTVLSGYDWVDLRLSVDTLARTIQPRFSVDDEPFLDVGPPLALPAGSALEQAFFADPALAVGVMASATPPVPLFTATWDSIQVQLGGP